MHYLNRRAPGDVRARVFQFLTGTRKGQIWSRDRGEAVELCFLRGRKVPWVQELIFCGTYRVVIHTVPFKEDCNQSTYLGSCYCTRCRFAIALEARQNMPKWSSLALYLLMEFSLKRRLFARSRNTPFEVRFRFSIRTSFVIVVLCWYRIDAAFAVGTGICST